MNISPPPSFQEGYEPGSVELNYDEGLLEITHPSQVHLAQEADYVPETLILRCTLRPIPLFNRTPRIRLISENEPCEAVSLYDEGSVSIGYDRSIKDSQWQGIAVEYAGTGRGVHLGENFSFSENTLSTGQIEVSSPLYLKPFCTETNSLEIRTTTVAMGHVLTSSPGVLNTRILRGYGGYYRSGVSLDHIEQVYYALTSDYDKTRIRLYTSSMLREQHTPSPRGGRMGTQDVLFMPIPREEEYLSLPASLGAGHAHFSLKTEFGNITYTSTLCESVPGHPVFVNVHFRPYL